MPSGDPKFLSREQVKKWHLFSLREYGGSDGLRSEVGLESALGAPINDFYYGGADLYGVAAAYAFHIEQAQAYLDGNKRTGGAAALAFSQINGVSTNCDAFPLYEALVAVAERTMTKAELAEQSSGCLAVEVVRFPRGTCPLGQTRSILLPFACTDPPSPSCLPPAIPPNLPPRRPISRVRWNDWKRWSSRWKIPSFRLKNSSALTRRAPGSSRCAPSV